MTDADKNQIRKEKEAYLALKDALWPRLEGRYVLFCGTIFQGHYASFDDAYREGVMRFGREDRVFLVQLVEKEESPIFVPSCFSSTPQNAPTSLSP